MDNHMTPARLAEIQARVDAATPGTWVSELYGRYEDHDECGISLDDDTIESCKYENLEFISAARTDIPDLLGEVRRLTAEIAHTKRERDAAVHDIKLGYGCETCKYVHIGQGEPYMCYLRGCKSPIDWEKWDWRGPCEENAKEVE